MTPLLFLAVAAAGGLGAALRFVLDLVVTPLGRGRIPLGMLLINTTGSFALGVVTALAAATVLDEPIALVLGIGLLGGYTTFSTVSVETVRLIEQRRLLTAAMNSIGMLVLCVALAGAGFAAARAVALA